MQVFDDVGGCDAWLSGYWEDGPNGSSQWWTGWHLPGAAGLAGLQAWQWPNPNWILIGYERWGYFRKGDRLLEACYATPNPSTTQPPLREPDGHWHMAWHPNGSLRTSGWSDQVLVDDHPYLKGGHTGPKGTGKGNAAPKGGQAAGKGGNAAGKAKAKAKAKSKGGKQ